MVSRVRRVVWRTVGARADLGTTSLPSPAAARTLSPLRRGGAASLEVLPPGCLKSLLAL
jgi:hypothetical protein